MLKRVALRVALVGVLLLSIPVISGCAGTDSDAKPQTLAPQPHERHDTGMDSQVSDY